MKQIAFINDLHLDEEYPHHQGADSRKNFSRVLDDIEKRGIRHLILGGDLGETESHEYLFSCIKDYSFDIILGNHDKLEAVTKHYNNTFFQGGDELYYSYSDDHIKYIFLDSSTAELSGDQWNWLSDELHTDKKPIIFIHHPVLRVNTIVDRKYPLKYREIVNDVLVGSQKDITVFCAHYHLEDEKTIKNITQYITPAVSYQIKKDPDQLITDSTTFGYRIITIDRDVVSSEVISFKAEPVRK